MTTQSQKSKNKRKIFALIVGVAFASSLLASAIGTLATYPTAAHRDAAKELSAYSDKAFSNGGTGTDIFETQEYKELNESPESKYSLYGTFASAAFGLAVTVVTIGYIYAYLRRYRIASQPVAMTTFLYSAGAVLSTIATIYITNYYLGVSPPAALSILTSALFMLTFGTLVNYLIVRIIHWRYNRKYGFVEE